MQTEVNIDLIDLAECRAIKRRTAAAMLECGETKIRELCKAGKLETVKVGQDTRIKLASVRKFIADGGDK